MVCISPVGASAREPVPGWVESHNGVTPYILAVLTGLVRVTLSEPDARANIVPLDYTVNAVLALAYSIATSQK